MRFMVVQADVHELAMGGDQKIGPTIRRPMLRLRESCRYVLPNNRADGAEIYVPAISQVENQSYQCRGRASSLLVLHSPSKRSSIQVNEVQTNNCCTRLREEDVTSIPRNLLGQHSTTP